MVNYRELFWSFLGTFFGIGIIAFIQSFYLTDVENVLLTGSFGAASVLIYAAIQSPLTQPRNFFGGQILSALVGVTIYKLFPDVLWIAAPLAVSLSIVIMQITKTLHPPGGATALIAVIGTENIKSLGYMYVLSPVLAGTVILFVVALIFNNATRHRHYPSNGQLSSFIKTKLFNQKIR